MTLHVDPRGFIRRGARRWRCALGTGGVRADKREGDGATPAGTWPLGRVFYRADRIAPPDTPLALTPLHPDMGWCDDSAHADYNTLITCPHPARHERMWRDDAVYDVIVELLYNTDPVQPGRGSAIFMHVAKPDYSPTEGCIALRRDDLLDLLRDGTKDEAVRIEPPGA